MIKEQFVNTILVEIKKRVSQGYFTIVNRRKNVEFMREHFLKIEDIKEFIFDLSFRNNYVKGPEEDRDDFEGQIWVFKYIFDKEMIYIKIRYNDPEVVCISVHKDEPL